MKKKQVVPVAMDPEVRSFGFEFHGMPDGELSGEMRDGRIVFRFRGAAGRCSPCWRAGVVDPTKVGPYCHRCGSDEVLT